MVILARSIVLQARADCWVAFHKTVSLPSRWGRVAAEPARVAKPRPREGPPVPAQSQPRTSQWKRTARTSATPSNLRSQAQSGTSAHFRYYETEYPLFLSLPQFASVVENHWSPVSVARNARWHASDEPNLARGEV